MIATTTTEPKTAHPSQLRKSTVSWGSRLGEIGEVSTAVV